MTRARFFAWPGALGATVALIGLGSTAVSLAECLKEGLFTEHPGAIPASSWIALVISSAIIGLSIALFRARRWALRLLSFLAILALAYMIATGVPLVRREFALPDNDSIGEDQLAAWQREAWTRGLGTTGFVVAVLAVQGFLTLALLHPAVVTAFPARVVIESEKTTNQETERTADHS